MSSEYFTLWRNTFATVPLSTLPAELDGVNFHLTHLSKFTHGFRIIHSMVEYPRSGPVIYTSCQTRWRKPPSRTSQQIYSWISNISLYRRIPSFRSRYLHFLSNFHLGHISKCTHEFRIIHSMAECLRYGLVIYM